MVKQHHLAQSIQDAGRSQFLTILRAKAAWAGRRVVAVPPGATSHAGGGCGVLVAKGLPGRWHARPGRGTSLQRDHHAAKQSDRLGLRLWGGVALAVA
jgi:putative transposase